MLACGGELRKPELLRPLGAAVGYAPRVKLRSARAVLSSLVLAACTVTTASTPSASSSPGPRATPSPTAPSQSATTRPDRSAPAPTERVVVAADDPNRVLKSGLVFQVLPKPIKLDGGWGLQVEVEVEAADQSTRVVYGYARGLAVSGVRMGNMNGMQPMAEGGKVQRFGRVRPGARLTLSRRYPSQGETDWPVLVPGDSMVLSLRTWVSEGPDPVTDPTPVEIAGVSISIEDDGRPRVRVEKTKD